MGGEVKAILTVDGVNKTLDKSSYECFMDLGYLMGEPDEKIGISLSGGLDNRAIFAAVNHLYPDYKGYAYTFGVPECDDITIAEQVIARSKNWKYGNLLKLKY